MDAVTQLLMIVWTWLITNIQDPWNPGHDLVSPGECIGGLIIILVVVGLLVRVFDDCMSKNY